MTPDRRRYARERIVEGNGDELAELLREALDHCDEIEAELAEYVVRLRPGPTDDTPPMRRPRRGR